MNYSSTVQTAQMASALLCHKSSSSLVQNVIQIRLKQLNDINLMQLILQYISQQKQ